MLTTSAYAQSPREQLNQMVQQLQQTPNDNALREKIIKLSTSIKPAPAIPEEALRREGRAKFAFKSAKSNDDYLGAAREYEEAVQVAPWVSGYYLDLCTIYEKAEKYAEAKRNCQLSLIGLSEPSQINEVKQRIAGLEFGIEKAAGDSKKKAKTLIVPGVGIGDIRFGMLESQVVAVLGAPQSRTLTLVKISGQYVKDGSVLLMYDKFQVYVSHDRGVNSVTVKYPGFVTSEGIGVGSSKTEVSSAMGSPSRLEKHNDGSEYWEYGQTFTFFFDNPQSLSTVSEVHLSK